MRDNEERQSSSTAVSCPGPLIVVSNRQPYRHEYVEDEDEHENEDGDGHENESSITVDRPTGGLTAGLDPVVCQEGGTWIAWGDGEADNEVTDENGCVAVPPESEAYTLKRLWLSEAEVDAYYYGFSNRVLWPLCHEFPELIEDRPGDRAGYRAVNRTFAEAIIERATPDSIVWLQDYHLGLTPSMVRKSVPDSVTIAQFWHIPWPRPGVFEVCPDGEKLLEGLLGNDILGFHVPRYCETFIESVSQFLPEATVDRSNQVITYAGSETQLIATPMGIDAETHDHRARSLDGSEWQTLRERYDIPAGNRIGVGVDRLDYSKGIPERLAAIERLLECRPEWRGSFTFVQKATPSRTEIPAYDRLGRLVRNEVSRINTRFETRRWRPIVYTEEFLSREHLCALYGRADVMIVSPLLDGMNLVAQEFLAASTDGDGALLLSRGTGAHDSLCEEVFTIDPQDIDSFARRIDDALRTPSAERRSRLQRLRGHVFENDLDAWMAAQFAAIARQHEPTPADVTEPPAFETH